MAKNNMTDAQLFDWVMMVLKREQSAGTFGTVVIRLEAGTITRVNTERTETPAFTNDGRR